MVDNSKNTALQVIKTSKSGVKFYSFIDPLQIPPMRGLAVEQAKRFVDMNITERSLKELIRVFKTECGAGDIVKGMWVIQEIEFRLNFICEKSSLLDLACIYFMLEEENPEVPSDAINRKKHALFNEDPELAGFFLRLALSIVKKFSGKREEDLLNYLQDNEEMSNRIRRYIAEEPLINSIPG